MRNGVQNVYLRNENRISTFQSYFPGYNNSMRNLEEDSRHSIMPLFYTSNPVTNRQYRNGFMSGIETNGCPGHGKDELKQKILEHEAVFKNQVCELHRLYSIQRGIMDCGGRASTEEPLCSSSIQGSEEAIKRHMAGLTMPPKYGHTRTSILGVEALDSCVSCKKQNSTQPNLFPFHSGSTMTRDCEVLGFSPSKVRKKLFDLQHPPDEYMDGEEEDRKLSNCKYASDMSQYAPNGNLITDSQGLKRRSIGFYDLNEPVKSGEEDAVASSFDFLSHASVNGDTKATLDVSDGVLKKSNTRRKAGLNQNNTCPIAKDYHYLNKTPLFSQSSKGELDQFHHGPGRDPTGSFWRDRHGHGLKSTDRIHGIPNTNHLDHITSWPLGSWAQSVLPWAKSSSDSAQKMRSTFENSSRIWKPSILSQEQLGVKWQVDSSTESNLGVASKLRTSNGFYHRSGSGSKGPARFGFLNGSFHADSFKYGIDINSNEINSKISSDKAVVMQDLNIAAINNAPEDQLPPLSWLNSNLTHCTDAGSGKTSYFHATSNHLCCKNETIIDLNDLNQPDSSDSGIVRKNMISENQSVMKILGVPISDREIERSSLDSGREVKNIKNERKNQTIDLNLAWEPDELKASGELHMKKQNKGAPMRNFIDLNSCVDDFEDPPTPYNANKVTLDIDLEVPARTESEDDASLSVETKSVKVSIQSSVIDGDQRVDAVLENAATIMIDMSSLCSQNHITDTSISQDPLHWFVDTIFSCENELNPIIHEEETTVRCGSSHHDLPLEIDEFEAMTLQLQETKGEDYTHKHFVAQIAIMDEAEEKLPTRSRARRGRQRKNFQRDVLPGMTSLSRHEVSEDLQTFSGIMRAMGHSWNGGARGRRRSTVSAVRNHVSTRSTQKISNGEVGFEDRSLTGWGKTTRRPRRQRCAPTGHHQMYVWT